MYSRAAVAAVLLLLPAFVLAQDACPLHSSVPDCPELGTPSAMARCSGINYDNTTRALSWWDWSPVCACNVGFTCASGACGFECLVCGAKVLMRGMALPCVPTGPPPPGKRALKIFIDSAHALPIRSLDGSFNTTSAQLQPYVVLHRSTNATLESNTPPVHSTVTRSSPDPVWRQYLQLGDFSFESLHTTKKMLTVHHQAGTVQNPTSDPLLIRRTFDASPYWGEQDWLTLYFRDASVIVQVSATECTTKDKCVVVDAAAPTATSGPNTFNTVTIVASSVAGLAVLVAIVVVTYRHKSQRPSQGRNAEKELYTPLAEE